MLDPIDVATKTEVRMQAYQADLCIFHYY